MNEIHELMQEVTAFSQERDGDQFHSPDNLAKSIAIEAAELLECDCPGRTKAEDRYDYFPGCSGAWK